MSCGQTLMDLTESLRSGDLTGVLGDLGVPGVGDFWLFACCWPLIHQGAGSSTFDILLKNAWRWRCAIIEKSRRSYQFFNTWITTAFLQN